MGVKYIKVNRRTLTILRVSSKRMNMIDIANPRPAVRNASATPTTITKGRVIASACPEIQHTRDKGSKPMKKFARPANADEIAKICGGT